MPDAALQTSNLIMFGVVIAMIAMAVILAIVDLIKRGRP